MHFEIRLKVGKLRWLWGAHTDRAEGLGGTATFLSVPEFCRSAEFDASFPQNAKAHWLLWRMNYRNLPSELIDGPNRCCNPIRLTSQTRTIAFVCLDHTAEVRFDICLSTLDTDRTRLPVFHDWERRIAAAYASTDQQALMRVNLPADFMREFDLDRFKKHTALGCTDVELIIHSQAPAVE